MLSHRNFLNNTLGVDLALAMQGTQQTAPQVPRRCNECLSALCEII
jgi:hypothetical protein